ncbi:MAG: hypothetical protein QOH56_512 [Pseudonocardiales bacterium]|nr:acetyl-CoA carboxylase biotin carboxyl carrier protein subunit [Frankiales bacterium]MDQ1734261.1 hypothetical protein [Pseudonocardiales bacterium]
MNGTDSTDDTAGTAASAPAEAAGRPALRIIKGNPTPAEVAAVTVVLTVVTSGAGEPDRGEQVRAGGWADPARRLRQPIPPGPGAWRASARP